MRTMRRTVAISVFAGLAGFALGMGALTALGGLDRVLSADLGRLEDDLYLERAINAQLVGKIGDLSRLIPDSPPDEVCGPVIIVLPYEDEYTDGVIDAPWYIRACVTDFHLVEAPGGP